MIQNGARRCDALAGYGPHHVASQIGDQLLQPDRLEEVLASVLDRRHERSERRQEHIAEPNRRAAEADLRLKRLYDAIEPGVADLRTGR